GPHGRRSRAGGRGRADRARTLVAAAAASARLPEGGARARAAPRGDHVDCDDRRVPTRDERDGDPQERARRPKPFGRTQRSSGGLSLRADPPPSSYAARMTRLRDREGGALTKVLATLLVLALLASAALFVYTRSQDPLALGVDASVGYNGALADHGTPTDPLVKLEPNGQIYVATTVRNERSLPVTITGLGQSPNDDQTPYIPVE